MKQLQESLRIYTAANNARKKRLRPLVEEHMAYQEYLSILDDLDKQVDQAFIKRLKGIKKRKKGSNLPNVIQQTSSAESSRALLEKRKRWIKKIGPAFAPPEIMKRVPSESIFQDLAVEDERTGE
ncbi:hypothetical protein CANCADRAFT_31171, partial [Tortispora caseinolytica NRRL Y-17796]